MNMPVEVFVDPVAENARMMIAHLGEDPHRSGLTGTPKRYAKAMRFLTGGYEAEPEDVVGGGIFDAEGDGVVLVRDIEFHSLCERHLLPFFGRVHVAYLPRDRIIGLSKIPRIVDLYARRLQVQERITEQVADALVKLLEPKGVQRATFAWRCAASRNSTRPPLLEPCAASTCTTPWRARTLFP